MGKGRLEAFSDGVIAILITIMVLEMHAPATADWAGLRKIWPVFLSYLLSFVYLGIYWNNHHHLLHAARRVSAGVLWGNLHLLFWLSLVPFATAWQGQTTFAPLPTAVYGGVLLLAAVAYFVLQGAIIRADGPDSVVARAVGRDVKGKLSLLLYATAIPTALAAPVAATLLFWTVALIWLLPDRRIERELASP